MGTQSTWGLCVNKTANPGSSMATFRSLHQSSHKTANHGSSMATSFRIIFSTQNCKPWQFYGHFLESTKSGHKTANLGSSMAIVKKLQTLVVLWPLFGD